VAVDEAGNRSAVLPLGSVRVEVATPTPTMPAPTRTPTRATGTATASPGAAPAANGGCQMAPSGGSGWPLLALPALWILAGAGVPPRRRTPAPASGVGWSRQSDGPTNIALRA